jgi:hypothetical protein
MKKVAFKFFAALSLTALLGAVAVTQACAPAEGEGEGEGEGE